MGISKEQIQDDGDRPWGSSLNSLPIPMDLYTQFVLCNTIESNEQTL